MPPCSKFGSKGNPNVRPLWPHLAFDFDPTGKKTSPIFGLTVPGSQSGEKFAAVGLGSQARLWLKADSDTGAASTTRRQPSRPLLVWSFKQVRDLSVGKWENRSLELERKAESVEASTTGPSISKNGRYFMKYSQSIYIYIYIYWRFFLDVL